MFSPGGPTCAVQPGEVRARGGPASRPLHGDTVCPACGPACSSWPGTLEGRLPARLLPGPSGAAPRTVLHQPGAWGRAWRHWSRLLSSSCSRSLWNLGCGERPPRASEARLPRPRAFCTDIHWPVRGQELGAVGVCPIHADLAFQIPATPPRRTLPAPWKALVA